MTHPAAPACLNRPYTSNPSRKGGTVIAEDVDDLEEHRRRLCDPDAYRPPSCFHCGSVRLHAHDFRDRKLVGAGDAWERIRRYLCASCRGVWQILPAVICRHLHRTWDVVQSAAVAEGVIEAEAGTPSPPKIPRSTVHRWTGRLLAGALVLTQALAGAGAAVSEAIGRVGMDSTRGELVDGLTASGVLQGPRKLEGLAGWIHRVVPGVRLM